MFRYFAITVATVSAILALAGAGFMLILIASMVAVTILALGLILSRKIVSLDEMSTNTSEEPRR